MPCYFGAFKFSSDEKVKVSPEIRTARAEFLRETQIKNLLVQCDKNEHVTNSPFMGKTKKRDWKL